MRDITPRSEVDLILKSLGSAFGIVVLIAFFKVAFESFMSVAGLILPIRSGFPCTRTSCGSVPLLITKNEIFFTRLISPYPEPFVTEES